MKSNTVEDSIRRSIARRNCEVILRGDLKDFGSDKQIGRALNNLCERKKIVRIGRGVYARAIVNPISGAVVPEKGLNTLKEALKRLGVEVGLSIAEQENNMGKTTQVPTGRTVAVKGRVTRKLGYNGIYLNYERVNSATV